ncbi:hypothetical protein E2C01_024619 [Portunus trituberculatus]|uniref:Uncharacterized protein n=1 Tax=Portunus trituberculatus TaxID=210409 RepID=A0A5B7EEA0_PORTR|nr:hypothetical protein [Portunus trituberculatus]
MRNYRLPSPQAITHLPSLFNELCLNSSLRPSPTHLCEGVEWHKGPRSVVHHYYVRWDFLRRQRLHSHSDGSVPAASTLHHTKETTSTDTAPGTKAGASRMKRR